MCHVNDDCLIYYQVGPCNCIVLHISNRISSLFFAYLNSRWVFPHHCTDVRFAGTNSVENNFHRIYSVDEDIQLELLSTTMLGRLKSMRINV